MKKIAVLLANGFEEVEAITPIDLLRRAQVSVELITIDTNTATSNHGVIIAGDSILSQEHLNVEYDAIIIPGGQPGSDNIANNHMAIQLIKKMASKNKIIASICAAPSIVLGGKTSILSGESFTCFPSTEKHVDYELNPNAQYLPEASVVVSHRLITARGLGVALLFSLEIITLLCSREQSERIKQETQTSYVNQPITYSV